MKGKLKFVIPLALLIVLAGAYKMVLAKPAEKKSKVHGTVYVLPKEFLINLSDSRFAKLSVALVLPEGQAPVEGASHATPPEGYGAMTQEGIVRSLITGELTDKPADDLTNEKKREEVQKDIVKVIKKKTDVKIEEVFFSDLTVQ